MRGDLLGLIGLGLAVVTACAGPQKIVTVPPGTGEKVIQIKASSFEFDPNIIKANQGDRLTLVIQNTAGMTHNFTLKNPSGEILVSKELPEEKDVNVDVSLVQVGEYPFYCDKPLHATFGMEGRIVVPK